MTTVALVTSLELAVPLWQEQVRGLTDSQRMARARRCAAEVAAHGDVLQYGGKRRGAAAEAFNALAEGLAIASFQPGGVTFAGRTWQANPPASTDDRETS